MNWYLKVLRQYADFSGRARRKELWMFVLFNMIFSIVTVILDFVLGITLLEILYSLVVLLPGLAVQVRRLHDIGKSGGWWFIILIPIIGPIWLLVLFMTDSDSDNKYGIRPK